MIPLILAAAAAAIPIAPVPPEKTFGDWTVACDNLRDCAGVSLTETAGDDTAWVVHFTRRSGAGAPVVVEALPAFMESDPGPVTFLIDGKKSAFGTNANREVTGGPEKLLAAIAAAKKVAVVDAKGKNVGFVPVAGSSAALRWVDDQQRRAGTVTALVAKGAKPASAVPPPPAAPRIAVPAASKSPPKKLGKADIAKILKLSDFCDSESGPSHDVGYWRLDAGHTLAIVPCAMGAYQGSALVLVVDNAGRWSPAAIQPYWKNPEPVDPADGFNLTEADYDPDNRLLLTMAKGRGLADCGLGASWAWDGKVFRLASYEELDVCQGAPPGTWLPRWHTANDPLRDQ
jgi:hypothetical protein